jgi:hypothetical protein
VRAIPSLVPLPDRGQEPLLAHQAQHAVLAHLDPFVPQTDRNLLVPLAQEAALLQYAPDLLDQLWIRERRLRNPSSALVATRPRLAPGRRRRWGAPPAKRSRLG